MVQEIQGMEAALAAYGCSDAAVEPLGSGLINLTWLLRRPGGEQLVLQRVAPVFPPEINRDIDVVSRLLTKEGLTAPAVIPSQQGTLWVHAVGHTWRMLSWLDGDCHDALETAAQARSAGRLLARFHSCLADLSHEFANPRLGVHDTARHLATLRAALEEHTDHPRRAQVLPLAEAILEAAAQLPEIPNCPDRVVHGDPKINNMLFDRGTGEAFALVDLDTVGRMPLPLELGDAFRSWCNPTGEDGRRGEFSAEFFAAGLAGYAAEARGWILPVEIRAIMPGVETIIIELAARFCADALNEAYFGWDAARFATRGEHNEVRAAGQLSLAQSFARQRTELTDCLFEAFGLQTD